MGQIMNFDQLYPGRFLKAGHFEQPRTLRIRDIVHEELHGDKGPQIKVIITFDDEPLGLVACKTNGLCLRHMFGSHVPNWVGKRVTLFASEWNGEPCIRIWGSPELERDEECIVQLPRRKPFAMKLRTTKPDVPAAAKPSYSERAMRLRKQIHDANDSLSLAHVTDAIAAESGLAPYEAEALGKALAKRGKELTGG